MSSAWSVLQAITGKEAQVANQIMLRDIAYACVPTRRLFERQHGQWRYIMKTLIPGYVFVRAAMTPEIYYAILDVPHAMHFLGKEDDGMPQAVADGQMAAILALADGDPHESMIVSINRRNRRATIFIDLPGGAIYQDVAYTPRRI